MRLHQLLQCNSLGFILVCALYFTLFQNLLFIHQAWSFITFDNFHSVFFAATIPMVIFCALNIIFSVSALPFLRKPLVIILLLGSAVSNYVMYRFGVLIDGNMIQNAFGTTADEATPLLTSRRGLGFLLLGMLPAIWVCFVRINKTRPWWYMIGMHAANVMLSVVVILLVAAFFYKDYASLIHNHKSVVKMLAPTNVVSGSIKYAQHRYFH